MNKIQFDINNKIDFIREGEELGTSLVQDWREDSFLVSIPLKGYRKKLLIVGEWITGFYYDAKKRVYMFQSRVLGRVIQNIPMYRLSIPVQGSEKGLCTGSHNHPHCICKDQPGRNRFCGGCVRPRSAAFGGERKGLSGFVGKRYGTGFERRRDESQCR